MKYLYWILILLLLIGCGKQTKEKRQDAEESVKIENVTTQPEEKDIELDVLTAEELIYETRYDEAISLLKRLIEIDPENAELYYLLGRAYEGAGLDELSVQAFMKAIQLDPKIAGESGEGG